MSRAQDDLLRDRALRDAAWEVVAQDVSWLQADLERRSVGGRVIDRLGEGAKTVAGKAGKAAGKNRGVIALVVGAVALWLARAPILRGLSRLLRKSGDAAQSGVNADADIRETEEPEEVNA